MVDNSGPSSTSIFITRLLTQYLPNQQGFMGGTNSGAELQLVYL
jgi:hypothetical protein